MPIDDTADKLRRNVVGLSAMIIFYFFMSPALAQNSSVFGFAVAGLNPRRVCLCVGFVLSYVFLRFCHHDEAIEGRNNLRKEFKAVVNGIVTRVLLWNFRASMQNAKWNLFFDIDEMKLALEQAMAQQQVASIDSDSLSLGFSESTISVGAKYTVHAGDFIDFRTIDSQGIPFDYPWWLVAAARCVAVVNALLSMRILINILSPYLLALVAFMCLFRSYFW